MGLPLKCVTRRRAADPSLHSTNANVSVSSPTMRRMLSPNFERACCWNSWWCPSDLSPRTTATRESNPPCTVSAHPPREHLFVGTSWEFRDLKR